MGWLSVIALVVVAISGTFGVGEYDSGLSGVSQVLGFGIYGNRIMLPTAGSTGRFDYYSAFGLNPLDSQNDYLSLSLVGGMSGLGRRGIRPCRYEMCRNRRIRPNCQYTPIQRRRRGRGFCLGCPVNICRGRRRFNRLRRRLCRRMGICLNSNGVGGSLVGSSNFHVGHVHVPVPAVSIPSFQVSQVSVPFAEVAYRPRPVQIVPQTPIYTEQYEPSRPRPRQRRPPRQTRGY